MRRFDLIPFLETVKKFNITDLTFVPPIAIAILMAPITHQQPFLQNVKMAVSGAAPLDKAIQTRLQKLLSNNAPFTQVWGMTETCCVAMMFAYPEDDKTGSVGRLIANVEAKLVLSFRSFHLHFVNFNSSESLWY
jgi:acyl-CoA synthetase (AMP-forming)/AMP-acid ligase II